MEAEDVSDVDSEVAAVGDGVIVLEALLELVWVEEAVAVAV